MDTSSTSPSQQEGPSAPGATVPVEAADEARTVALRIMPWAISLLLHVMVVLLAIFIVWSVRLEHNPEEYIVPDARLSRAPPTPLQARAKQTSTRSQSARRSVAQAQSEGLALEANPLESISRLVGVVGATSGTNSPFGDAIRAAGSFDVSFYGTGGNAKKIAYVIDASGSLIDSLDFVINELKRSIHELHEPQVYAVFFFQDDRVVEVPPRGLKPANAANREKVIKWIDPSAGHIIAGGKTNPIMAIERALKYRPHVLFLLSDNITGQGIYQIDQQRLLKAIKRANKHQTKINTFQFLYADPLERHGLTGTMQLIADATGGRYKFVDARELGYE